MINLNIKYHLMDYCNTQKICCVPERRAQKGAFKALFYA